MPHQPKYCCIQHLFEFINIHNIWLGILQRCNNPRNKKYKDYGGRGITICREWQDTNGFENFLVDVGVRPESQYSLDRINNDRDYCKENCRWATPKEQNRNSRNNVNITFRNKTQCLTAWAEELGIKRRTLSMRLHTYGWTIEKHC